MYIVASPAFRSAEQNPYTSQLSAHLQRRGHRVEDFAPSALLGARPDVWHLHWPDHQLTTSTAQAATRVAALSALLGLSKVRGTRIVWTAHNVRSHEGRHPLLERVLWRAVGWAVDGVIALSSSGADELRQVRPATRHVPCAVIPHGHYRDVYGDPVDKTEARERLRLAPDGLLLLHLGQLRPYKNVHGLVDAFADADLPDASLLVAGQPIDRALRAALERAAHGVPNVELRLRFVPPGEIRLYYSACDLVVLPYTAFSNSGSAILGLSFDRPIVVPANPATAELRDWYGPRWVRTYHGRLSGEVLERAATAPLPTDRLALPQLQWPAIAERTEQFYQRLLQERS